MRKRRLDDILQEMGSVPDKQAAFIVVTEGRVLVNGQKAISPAQPVAENARIEVRQPRLYVGRGALKLKAALEAFDMPVAGVVCADIGAATGGFTQMLLERGAAKVYAIDTARGKLAPQIADDPRVVVMDGVDVRDLHEFLEPVDVAVIDVSLIPLEGILPSVKRLLASNGIVAALFKPQYETRDQSILRHGIVIDDRAREALIEHFASWAHDNGWDVRSRIPSPIRGSKGNVEYLFLLAPSS